MGGVCGTGGGYGANGSGTCGAAAGEIGGRAMSTRRPWLLPLAPLYGAALAMKRRLFQLGWLKQNRLESPVISVGSVSAGGAGKTPMVLLLARILRHRGYAVRILTRGYKRSSDVTSRVEPFDDAAWQGDGPVVLAQRSGGP